MRTPLLRKEVGEGQFMLRDHIINYRFRFVICFVCALGVSVTGVSRAQTPWVEHRLSQGDTIYGIARDYDVSVQSVLAFNNIDDPTRLSPGRVIQIPGVLTVTRGQTLYGLAQQYEVTVADLRSANDFAADYVLRIGDRLRIPGSFSNGSVVDNSDEPTEGGAGEEGSGRDVTEDGRETDTSDEEGVTDGAGSDRDLAVPSGDVVTDQQNGAVALHWPHAGPREVRGGRVPGVSIRADAGDTVYAVASGIVSYVGPYATFGRVVIVQASTGYAFVYGGHESVVVAPGDAVSPGTELGNVGTTGEVAEVYFSVWRGDDPVNPDEAPRL